MTGNRTVLVVDDEPIVRTSCRRVLEPEGYAITTVNDGLEALSLLRERSFDIIITDLKMPNMDGVEFIGMLRQTASDSLILLVTGFATEEVRHQAEAMGAMYLPKPFTPGELKEAVDSL